jgi:hypothetical protein
MTKTMKKKRLAQTNRFTIGQIAICTMAILTVSSVTCIAASEYSLSVETGQETYYPSETVYIWGYLTENGQGVPNSDIYINVTNPDTEIIFNEYLSTEHDGFYYATFSLELNTTLGLYNVTAVSLEFGVQAFTQFEVIPVMCGDCNGDKMINIADVVTLLDIFHYGPGPRPWCAGDVNSDGSVNCADIIYLVNYLFKYGPVPNSDCCVST